MRCVWPALLLAPSLALAELSISYSMVTPACARQSVLALNVVAAVMFVLCLGMTLQAWRNWRREDSLGPRASDDAAGKQRFIAQVATMVGGLSTLVVLALWFPQWVLSPCAN